MLLLAHSHPIGVHTKARQIVNREAEKQATSHLGTTNDLTVLRGGERRNEEEEKNREFPSCATQLCKSIEKITGVASLSLSLGRQRVRILILRSQTRLWINVEEGEEISAREVFGAK